jgi:hypothetical protein
MRRRFVEQVIWVLTIAGLLVASPRVPEPIGYGAAMAALLVGPGHGLPDALFRFGYLSTPERWLLTALTSIGLVVVVLYSTLTVSHQLDGRSASIAVLALTIASSLVNVLSARTHSAPGDANARQSRHRRLAFATGIVAGLLIGAIAWRFVGL